MPAKHLLGGTWSLAEAKAKFSELVERARTEGPQHLTKNGKDAAVMLSAEEYERLKAAGEDQTPGFSEALFDPSIRGLLTNEEADELFARDKDVVGRPVDL
jgi:prevent-host-death family protein